MSQTNQSEVARLLNQIREEYEAAVNGLSGLSQGQCRHAFITARMENMGKLQTQLDELVGDDASVLLVATALDDCESSTSA